MRTNPAPDGGSLVRVDDRRRIGIAPTLLVAAIVAVVATAAVVVVARHDSDNEGARALAVAPPGLLTAGQLRERVREAGAAVYWVGPASGVWYELTRQVDGSTLVRYVPKSGSTAPAAPLTVATYPRATGFEDVLAASRRANAVDLRLANGAVATYDRDLPTSVYVAFPGAAAQIEVFDARPGAARKAVGSGRVVPVIRASAAVARPFVASLAELRAFARSLPTRIYWAGPRRSARYEVTRTANSAVYVRYLPPGVEAGDRRKGLLTIATYPHAGALDDVKAVAKLAGTVGLPVDRGAAVYYKAAPSSVHLAFAGEDLQIEVYNATRDAAETLVRDGRIVAVG